MTNTLSNPLGKGTCNHNSIIFSCGVGVQSPVSKQILWGNVINLAKNPQNVEKKLASWILPNNSPVRKRQNAKCSEFGLIWVDVDNPPSGGIDSVIKTLIKSAPYLAYTTKGATESVQKCRVLIPLSEALDFGSWLHNQKRLNAVLEGAGIEADSCNLNPAQILFLPNRGCYYAYKHREGLFNAKPSQEGNPTPNHPPSMASISSMQPRTAPSRGGVIDRFKASFSVSDILQQAGYAQNPYNPLQWRHPRSESGSFSASIDPSTGRVHSLSSRDPLWTGGGGVGAHDSFSVFCVLFCDNNQRLAVYKAANEMLAKGVSNGK